MLRYGIALTFDAPLRYVYEWCTDFRDDDPLLTGGPYSREIVRRSKDRIVWTQRLRRRGVEMVGVRVVTLEPPGTWHNEASDVGKESIFDYRLTPVGRNRTRLRITARTTYKKTNPEERSALESSLAETWAKYKELLEQDYKAGKGARA